jgi:hypothetical protein
MSSRVMFRPLCWLIFGHEPIIEVNERENKSVYVCERCRAMLGDFVTNLRKPRGQSGRRDTRQRALKSGLPSTCHRPLLISSTKQGPLEGRVALGTETSPTGPDAAGTLRGKGDEMIPHHILDDLRPDERVAILSRDGELHFLVHQASDSPSRIQEYADRDGSEVLTTHMQDKAGISRFVQARERDVGGEG